MKKIIIHAGPGKTGTSAIQYWCVTHRNTLQDNRIFYPKHSLDKNKVSNGHIDLIADKNDVEKYVINNDKLNVLLSDFHHSDNEILLLSSEYFVEYIPELIEKLESSQVLLYFRDPIELHQSSYIQKVKRHQNTEKYKNRNKINYPILNLLDKLMSLTDMSRVFVRPYDVSLSGSDDLVSDFLNFVKPNLAKKVAFEKSIRINDSYSYVALEFKRLCNFFPLGKLEMKLDSILQALEGRERDYSLLSEEAYNHHLSKMKLKISSMRSKNSASDSTLLLDNLSFWLASLEESKKKQYLPLCSLYELQQLSLKIKEYDVDFFHNLSFIVKNHDFIYVGNHDFFNLFDTSKKRKRDYFLMKKTSEPYSEPVISEPNMAALTVFKKRLGASPETRLVMIYAAMAEFMLESKEYGTAEKLINKAVQLNPTNELALSLVNPIRLAAQNQKYDK